MWISGLYYFENNVEKGKICAVFTFWIYLLGGEKMQNLKMVICYDGTRYSGWQKQGNTANTIQGKIEYLISEITGETVSVNGSGRTDAGVHAMGQVANVQLKSSMEPLELRNRLNALLPEDIAVKEIEEVPLRFHARLSAVGKVYQYRMYVGETKPVFERKQVTVLDNVSSLNVEAMRDGARRLCGIHDFTSFCGNPSFKKSAVRNVTQIEILEEGDELVFRFTGDGFLQNMVRIITGTLIEVGRGALTPEELSLILAAKDRKKAGPMAPAQGLMLMCVRYK